MDLDIERYIEEAKRFEEGAIESFGGGYVWIAESLRGDFMKWARTTELYLMNKYKSNKLVTEYSKTIENDKNTYHISTLRALVGILDAFNKIDLVETGKKDADETLQTIFDHFNQCVIQLKRRHDKRGTLTISDEYDVQDLLHALFKLHFDDVRPEEWCPSYAGGSKRMDFLLKEERIAIEVKMTRDKLKDKEIGEQLIVDIANYKNHPDVDKLYCFVYDPEPYISNPHGLEKDLSNDDGNLVVEVFIRPQ